MADTVDHPAHYGGEDNPYEVIKVIEAWGLGFCLGNVLKYIGRPTKGKYLEDLKKAAWYLKREIEKLEAEQYKAESLEERARTTTDYHGNALIPGGGYANLIAHHNNHTATESCNQGCSGWWSTQAGSGGNGRTPGRNWSIP